MRWDVVRQSAGANLLENGLVMLPRCGRLGPTTFPTLLELCIAADVTAATHSASRALTGLCSSDALGCRAAVCIVSGKDGRAVG